MDSWYSVFGYNTYENHPRNVILKHCLKCRIMRISVCSSHKDIIWCEIYVHLLRIKPMTWAKGTPKVKLLLSTVYFCFIQYFNQWSKQVRWINCSLILQVLEVRCSPKSCSGLFITCENQNFLREHIQEYLQCPAPQCDDGTSKTLNLTLRDKAEVVRDTHSGYELLIARTWRGNGLIRSNQGPLMEGKEKYWTEKDLFWPRRTTLFLKWWSVHIRLSFQSI